MTLGSEASRRMGIAMKSPRIGQEVEARLGGLGLTGDVYYCDPTDGDDGLGGQSPDTAVASMNTALGLCTANNGDVIVRRRGTETVTSTIEFDVAGVTVVAEGWGLSPEANGEEFATLADASFTDGPVATITASTRIIGLGFVSRDAGTTFFSGAALLVGGEGSADPFGAHLYECRFPKWNVDNRIGVAVEGSTDCTIERCTFEGVGADFDAGVYVQGATQNLNIRDNRFRQCTAAVQFGAFAGGGPHVFLGPDNVVEDGKLLDTQGNAGNGLIFGNWLETATDSASYDRSVATLQGDGYNFAGNNYSE